jgi:hypothetical protein
VDSRHPSCARVCVRCSGARPAFCQQPRARASVWTSRSICNRTRASGCCHCGSTRATSHHQIVSVNRLNKRARPLALQSGRTTRCVTHSPAIICRTSKRGINRARTRTPRQPHHLRALPRACETEGRGAVLGHSTSEGRQDRADDGACLNVDMKKTNWGWRRRATPNECRPTLVRARQRFFQSAGRRVADPKTAKVSIGRR